MSRNDNRMGLPPESGDPTPSHPNTMNPPGMPGNSNGSFQWNVPTYFVKLPTQGKYYGPGHPCHGRDSIEIRYMTAKEEDILTSENLLKEGVAVNRAVQNMLMDQSIDIRSLLIQDRNALTVGARITGYGDEYDTEVTCTACGETNPYSFNLEECTERALEKTAKLLETLPDPEVDSEGNLLIYFTTPITNAVVGCRLFTGYDEEKMAKEAYLKNSRNSLITSLLRRMIVSVDGETNPLVVANFVHSLPTRDSTFLKKEYATQIPFFTLQQNYTCSSCSHSVDMEVPLNADFFWPN